MKRVVFVLALAVAAGAAQAQGEMDSSTPVTPRANTVRAPTLADAPKPRSNVLMFAPASAANAKPMSVQERDERQFLRDAAAALRFESEASRMALAKSDSTVVRSFASTLVRHHATAGNELQYMLQARSMAPPMLANDKRKTLNRLSKLQGTKFDREYMAQVGLKNQQEGVQAFERAGLATRDPQLKAWIDRTLPTMRYHLTTGERMAPPGPRLAGAGQTGSATVSRASWPNEPRTR